MRLGRKITLGALIFHLNYLFSNENFWLDVAERNALREQRLHIKPSTKRWHATLTTIILHIILHLRWILSVLILGLFVLHRLQPTITDEHQSFLDYCKLNGPVLILCLLIISLIGWDTKCDRNTLKQYGFEHFSTGLALRSKRKMEEMHPTCVVCFDETKFNYLDGQLSTQCQHVSRTVCDGCLFQHVQQRIQITFTDDIPCPEQNCNVIFDYHTVRNILLLGGDPHLIDRYDRYVVHRQLEQMEEFIWCANPRCHAGQLHDGGRSNPVVTCHNCHQKTCFQHKIQWHEGMNCEEYNLSNDPTQEASRQWVMQNSKKCPQCPYQIEKNQGCDHMTCIKCRHEFCWSCLADFQPIRQYGSSRHHTTCKHYVVC